ncbi:hypothetical protein [Echinicola sp. 20G]|uniref:hypothetical protein n=1 Tax=Echinicola sp. 20G TaxID=2781961 RepID=UPI0019101C72|nr:hypothetical protein [Echinicola sp. 20G]
MRKSGILACLICILGVVTSKAQIANLEMNGVPLRVSSYEGIQGTPFLFDDWSNATYTMEKGWTKENVSTKLNVYEKEILAVSDNGNQIILDRAQIHSFVLDRPQDEITENEGVLPKLVFEKGWNKIDGVKEDEFVNVMVKGEKYTLVRVFDRKLEDSSQNSYGPGPGKRFVSDVSYYLINGSGEANEVKTRGKSLLKALDPSDQNKGKGFIKDNNLNFNREDHLIQFVTYVN